VPVSRRCFVRASEARMAKRSRRAANEGQDARSERPAMGMGSPEPKANQRSTQVKNLCYLAHRLKTCATGDTQAASLCYEGTTTGKRETPPRLTRDGVCFVD
jgi:hypothetical protein